MSLGQKSYVVLQKLLHQDLDGDFVFCRLCMIGISSRARTSCGVGTHDDSNEAFASTTVINFRAIRKAANFLRLAQRKICRNLAGRRAMKILGGTVAPPSLVGVRTFRLHEGILRHGALPAIST
jgi:hypothetical protein